MHKKATLAALAATTTLTTAGAIPAPNEDYNLERSNNLQAGPIYNYPGGFKPASERTKAAAAAAAPSAILIARNPTTTIKSSVQDGEEEEADWPDWSEDAEPKAHVQARSDCEDLKERRGEGKGDTSPSSEDDRQTRISKCDAIAKKKAEKAEKARLKHIEQENAPIGCQTM